RDRFLNPRSNPGCRTGHKIVCHAFQSVVAVAEAKEVEAAAHILGLRDQRALRRSGSLIKISYQDRASTN
ncbi:MAG TPA: hypothetical protein VK639_12790, partial [Terriglobales bacterium]|nr:hypothetical protein [Terriglobales bacterium]